MGKRWKYVWHWICHWSDPHHGCWHADYDGRCSAKSRRGFNKKEDAEKAAQRHESQNYQHRGRTHVYRERKYFD